MSQFLAAFIVLFTANQLLCFDCFGNVSGALKYKIWIQRGKVVQSFNKCHKIIPILKFKPNAFLSSEFETKQK